MVWRPILHTRAASATVQRCGGGTVEQTGWILRWPDMAFPRVEVELFPSGERKVVNMAWADVPSLFESFVRQCGHLARYSVILRHDVIQRYTLWIEEEELNRQLSVRGQVDGEIALNALLHRLASDGQLSDDVECFKLSSAIRENRVGEGRGDVLSRLLDRGWPSTTPPYAGQLESIAWMRSVERAVIEEQDIEYEAGIPLGDSGWSYRVTQDQLRPSAHSGQGNARIRGCCCCDAVGTGKTASALGLVLLSEPLGPTNKDVIRVRTAATLVIVPTNLPQQWQAEAARFAPRLKVVMLLSLKDAKSMTMQSLMEADLVISTFSFLRGKPYLDSLEEHVRKVNGRQSTRRDVGALCTCARVMTHAADLTNFPPLIELLRWRRLVVDEIHEVLQNPRDLKVLRSLSVCTVVGLTGTPDTSSAEAVQAFYPLVLRPTRTDDEPPHHVCLQAAVEYGLLCQNDSMETLPEHVVVPVRLDAAERALVETCGRSMPPLDIVMLCCGVLGGADSTQTVSKRDLVASMASWNDTRMLEVSGSESAREEQERRFRFIRDRLPDLIDGTQCGICMDREVDALVLGCGHVLCDQCAQKSAMQTCPFCRSDVSKLVRVSPSGRGFGSRVDAACELIHSFVARGESALIFTQFRALLSNLDAALRSSGVRTLVLEGSTSRRASCARRFRERDVDVLLLCFERSISGLNLSEARHVVLLHPLVGHAHEVAAMEEQAVGRAHRRGQTNHVTVHHMVAEDTHEEELWKQRRV